MDHRYKYLTESRGLFCHVRLTPIHRSPPKREDTIRPSAADLWRRKQAERELKLPQVSNRGRSQLEPLRPRMLLSGLETSRVSLPNLQCFQPSRPAQPRPPKAALRRPLRTEAWTLGFGNSRGFPRNGAR